VSLGFDLSDNSWSLKKRFAGPAGKTFLQNSDGRRYEDEEAEAELQRLLGFTVSGRIAEPGIWGTFWVRQGRSFGDPALDKRARQTVHSCLEAQVGAVTGGLRGQRIPEAIESALAEITSSKGPRGRYKVASDQLVASTVKVKELEAKRHRLLAETERLTSLKRDLQNLNEDCNNEENRRHIEAARQKRTAAERKTEEIRTARSDAVLATERCDRARAEVNIRAGLITEIEHRKRSLQDLLHKIEIAAGAKDHAATLLTGRRVVLSELREGERKAAEAGRHLHRVRDVVLLGADLGRYEAIVGEAQEKQQQAERLGEQIGRLAATVTAIDEIDKAEVELWAATAALNAVATIVALSIRKDAIERVTIAGKSIIAADVTHEVVDDVVIGVAGVGDIAIRPQVKDRRVLLKRVDDANRALQAALVAINANTPADARAAAARRRELEHQLEGLRKELGRLAPGDIKSGLEPGLDALKIRIEQLRGRRDAEMAALGLDALPERSAVDDEIRKNGVEADQLAASVDATAAGLVGLTQAVEEAREECEALQRKLAAEQRELDTKKALLATGRNRAADDALELQATSLECTAAELQAVVTRLEQDRGETVEEIDAQIRRLENAARLYQDESTRLGIEIAKASGIITASGGDGVDEALDTARAEQSRLNAQVVAYEQEVTVLELLRDTLKTAEIEAKTRYLAPVVTRVQPYLNMLLPETGLILDEDLHITGLRRNGLEEEFARLSEGTQEQIAVLARLGFAELLRDQGRPATVILDDALAFSDDDRIERMFDIMTRAAERTQIIILTCRKRLFTRLGAPMLRIEVGD
jgi:hypothetical protein